MLTKERDAIWVAQIKSGDTLLEKEAWTALFNYYNPLLKYRVRRYDFSEEEVEDVVSSIFEKLVRLIKTSYDEKYAFSTWLFTICKSTTIDYTRKEAFKAKTLQLNEFHHGNKLVSKEEILDNIKSKEFNPEQLYLEKEKREMVFFLLEQLNSTKKGERYANLLYLRYYKDLTYEEICNELNISICQVKSILNRAKEKLRKIYFGN